MRKTKNVKIWQNPKNENLFLEEKWEKHETRESENGDTKGHLIDLGIFFVVENRCLEPAREVHPKGAKKRKYKGEKQESGGEAKSEL